MNIFKKLFNFVANKVVTFIGTVNWHTKRVLTEQERIEIKQLLKDDYYIIVTRHDGYLSSYAISLSHIFLTGKMGYYAHALMNLEDEVKTADDYRFIEATRNGVHYSGFDEIFNDQTSSVALLKPKHFSLEHWTAIMDKAKSYLGRPYDTLYDLANDNNISCVELVRDALRAEPDYDVNFANFEKLITSSKNLDPHMYYECEDFEVVWESRH